MSSSLGVHWLFSLHYSYSFLLQDLTGSTSVWCSLFLFGFDLAFLLRTSAIFKQT